MKYPNWNYAEGYKGSALALPAYAILARSAPDVQAALSFASQHNIQISVKSTGHSYTGRSTAAASLLVYLHGMRGVEWHAEYDDGCGSTPGPAVSVQPGINWGTLYPLASERGFVVTGGGGSTVSAAGGYVLGGGHSALSRSLGLAADNVLSIELVLANGTQLNVSRCDPMGGELFWALRGGGGGTFGVMVGVVIKLHPNPGFVGLSASYPMGNADGSGRGRGSGSGNASAWLLQVMRAQPLLPSEWGCYYQCTPGAAAASPLAKWKVDCLYYGNDTAAATASIAPLRAAWDDHPAAKAEWKLAEYASFWEWKKRDDGGDTTKFAAVLTSRIFPHSAFAPTPSSRSAPRGPHATQMIGMEALAASLTGAVRRGINLQIVLLLGGAAGGPHTANPNAVSEWMRAGLWHVVAATGWVPAEPAALQKEATAKVRAYGGELRRLVPASGAYLNENDWDEPDWQRSFWGADGTYERLLRVKRAVDPTGTFNCHNCVGSEETNPSGRGGAAGGSTATARAAAAATDINISTWAMLESSIAAAAGKAAVLTLSSKFAMTGYPTGGYDGIQISAAGTNITIIGNSATFDAKQNGRFFSVDGSSSCPATRNGRRSSCPTLNMSCVSFTNGYIGPDSSVAVGGAALYVQDGVITLLGCSFSENAAEYGGAMFVRGSTITLTNCTFAENTAAQGGGGAIYLDGGGNVTMTGCWLIKNNVPAGDDGGGAIDIDAAGGGGSIVLISCTFLRNFVHPDLVQGGAIWAYPGASVLIIGCDFEQPISVNKNDIVRADDTYPNAANITFGCPSGYSGSSVQMQGHRITVIPPKQLECIPIPSSFDCFNSKCVDPGTGKGLYNSSSACEAACGSPSSGSFDCHSGMCYGSAHGHFKTLTDCQAGCQTTGHPDERKILIALYAGTKQGDGWLPGCKVGWDPPTDNHCTWNGITCDGEGFVIKISLGGCGLKGVFPGPPSIFTFKRLQWVQMPESQDPYHPVPGELNGPLPHDLAFSTSLQRLELYGNTFSGTLEMLENIVGLIQLDLHFNEFSGPIPDLIKSAATLEYISLANNHHTGSIPSSFASYSNLDTLGLAYNMLTGNLDVISELKALKVVYMRNNSFVGEMPSIAQSAAVVDLDHNKLSSFPADVCEGPLPGAYSNSGGCDQDWPHQAFDTCCLSHNAFKCKGGAAPACLKNCGSVCPTPAPTPPPMPPTPSPGPGPAGVCKSTEYCCPDAKKCLTPTHKSCQGNANACSAGEVCCPLTKLCVKPGAACISLPH
eukprot:g2050.t1